jgi:molecular chaperone GrpE (heat shock protein)
MPSWIDKIFGKDAVKIIRNDELDTDMQGEIRRLQMESQERAETVTRLRSDIESMRGGESSRISAVTDSRLERLFDSIAAPAAQLTTQAYLVEAGKPVQARDVIAVAGSLIRALESEGFKVSEMTDNTQAYDPDLHQPISNDISINRGESVYVRIPSVTYNNRILRKAGVEKAEE